MVTPLFVAKAPVKTVVVSVLPAKDQPLFQNLRCNEVPRHWLQRVLAANLLEAFDRTDSILDSMKFTNVVLLGSPRANPWVELIEQQSEFRYVYDDVTHHSAFRSKENDAGNSRNFPTASKTSYYRIAYLPNLNGNGNILNIAGTETEGTEGGGQYVTGERTLEQLRLRLGVKDGPIPYFEDLLRSDRLGGATPQLSIVAARLIHPSN